MDYFKLIGKPLNLDSTFRFRCKQCGNCCRNREDILISPYDLFRIARHLSMTPKDVIDRYCHFYIGTGSHLPVVLLWAGTSIVHFSKAIAVPFTSVNRLFVRCSRWGALLMPAKVSEKCSFFFSLCPAAERMRSIPSANG